VTGVFIMLHKNWSLEIVSPQMPVIAW